MHFHGNDKSGWKLGRHCEERKRRRNPVFYGSWIATPSMRACDDDRGRAFAEVSIINF